jgi:hypothetical protein
MKDGIAVKIIITAVVKNRSMEEVDANCKELQANMRRRMNGDCDTTDIEVDYSLAEVARIEIRQ